MAVELICPECGGVIGGRGTSAEGRGPCTCSKDDSAVSAARDGDASDTVSIPVPSGDSEAPTIETSSAAAPAPASAAAPKLCIVCGKNVSGHRRVKDSRGYLCYQCAKSEVKAEKEGTIPCAECKRRVKEAGLVNYKGRKICKLCYDYNKDQERLKKKIDTKHFDEKDKQTVKILGIVFAILTVIVLWGVIKSMMHH